MHFVFVIEWELNVLPRAIHNQKQQSMAVNQSLKRSRSSFEHYSSKRVRTESSTSSHNSPEPEWAAKTASVRRAESLTSIAEDLDTLKSDTTVALEALALNEFPSPGTEWIPTAPSSPVSAQDDDVEPKKKSNYRVIQSSRLPSPVPAICPPADHGWLRPVSPENAAKLRIKRFIEREQALRTIQLGHLPSDSDWERSLGLGSSRRKKVVKWLLEVSSQLFLADFFYINIAVKVVPKFQDESDEEEGRCNDLHDQLITSPETRFHAVHMFLRFFAVMNLGKFDDDKDQMLVVWDLALSALALSVKVSSMYLYLFVMMIFCRYTETSWDHSDQ
jgi:hypothetical protein